MRTLVAAALALGVLVPGSAAPATSPTHRTVELTVRNSRFVPAVVEARDGDVLTIVVRNRDFIDHELIIGDTAVHERHESGTEPWHAAVPGEVSVAAWSGASTTWTVSGTVMFACHLPGHFAYGMQGVITTVT